jgi:hypothetical protein
MPNTQPNDSQTTMIQGILARYLELHARDLPPASAAHLDEDTLNAFTEGRVSERESTPVISHLSECSFCRRRTVELVRLAAYFDTLDEPLVVREEISKPVSVSSVLNGILSRIFGSGEAAVFAHEEKKESEESDARTEAESEEKK